jgi:hypothetical protein
MNFQHMPELADGYPVSLALIATACLAVVCRVQEAAMAVAGTAFHVTA